MRKLTIVRWLLAITVLMVVAGCSTDSPIETSNAALSVDQSVNLTAPPPDGRVQFAATVATVDYDQRLLTFEENTDVVYVPEDCPVVQVVAGVETALEFADIVVGAWVKVCAQLQDDGPLVANKIVVYPGGDCDGFDVAFRDSIATIDYAAGTFTVFGRTETIMIDETTVIKATIPYQYSDGPDKDDATIGSSDGGGGPEAQFQHAIDTILAFTDLQPGYILEIRANIIDEATLLAVKIKVVTSTFKQALTFDDCIVAIDYDNRLVTFDNEPLIGTVCSGAALLTAEGDPLLLADFVVGDCVAVKGVVLTEETFRICEMIK